jgi:hypothetical protein
MTRTTKKKKAPTPQQQQKQQQQQHVCKKCNHEFATAYTLNRHNTNTKCASAQNEEMFRHSSLRCGNCRFVTNNQNALDRHQATCLDHPDRQAADRDRDEVIVTLEKRILEQDRLHKQAMDDLTAQIEDLQVTLKAKDQVKKKIKKQEQGQDTTSDASPSSAKKSKSAQLPFKLRNIDTDALNPLTTNYIRQHLGKFTFVMFTKGAKGIAQFILDLVTPTDSKILVCTDVSRNKFYVLSDDSSADGGGDDDDDGKVWILDAGGGLNIINLILDQLQDLAAKYIDKLESANNREEGDMYMHIYDAIAATDSFNPLREKMAQRIRTILKEHLCI